MDPEMSQARGCYSCSMITLFTLTGFRVGTQAPYEPLALVISHRLSFMEKLFLKPPHLLSPCSSCFPCGFLPPPPSNSPSSTLIPSSLPLVTNREVLPFLLRVYVSTCAVGHTSSIRDSLVLLNLYHPSFFFFWLHYVACRILLIVPRPGIESMPCYSGSLES